MRSSAHRTSVRWFPAARGRHRGFASAFPARRGGATCCAPTWRAATRSGDRSQSGARSSRSSTAPITTSRLPGTLNHPSVPTWNYAVVHVHGQTARSSRIAADWQPWCATWSTHHEATSPNPWRMDLPADYQDKMLAGIVGFEIEITRLEGKFKLSQNRPVGGPAAGDRRPWNGSATTTPAALRR